MPLLVTYLARWAVAFAVASCVVPFAGHGFRVHTPLGREEWGNMRHVRPNRLGISGLGDCEASEGQGVAGTGIRTPEQ